MILNNQPEDPLLLARCKSHFCFLSSRPFRSKQASVSCTLLLVVLIDYGQFQLALGVFSFYHNFRVRPLSGIDSAACGGGVEAFLPCSSIPYPWGTRHSPPFSCVHLIPLTCICCASRFLPPQPRPGLLCFLWFLLTWFLNCKFNAMARFHKFLCPSRTWGHSVLVLVSYVNSVLSKFGILMLRCWLAGHDWAETLFLLTTPAYKRFEISPRRNLMICNRR